MRRTRGGERECEVKAEDVVDEEWDEWKGGAKTTAWMEEGGSIETACSLRMGEEGSVDDLGLTFTLSAALERDGIPDPDPERFERSEERWWNVSLR